MDSVPMMIVTDQDLGIKVAVARVLVGTRHRLCMWHIMEKVDEKLPKDLKKDKELFKSFKRRLCDIVWSMSIDRVVC